MIEIKEVKTSEKEPQKKEGAKKKKNTLCERNSALTNFLTLTSGSASFRSTKKPWLA